MQSGLFEPSQLTLLRELEGISKASLAKDLGVSPPTITGWENGSRVPTSSNVSRLALRFGVDAEFFSYANHGHSPDKPFFRSLRSTSLAERTKSSAYVDVVERVIKTLKTRVEFPCYRDLGMLGFETPEAAAAKVRAYLGIAESPISNLMEVVEEAGIFVVFGSRSSRSVDAFSRVCHPNPVVVLNPSKNDFYRQRFDLAHEVGHILLHTSDQVGSKEIEVEANQFASELLAPSKAIAHTLPSETAGDGWRRLRELKEEWGLSMQALLYRARHLGIMGDNAYRNAMVTVSKRGWRRGEPGNKFIPETPALLPSAISLLSDYGYGSTELAREAGVPFRYFEQVVRHTPFISQDSPSPKFSGGG